MAPGHRVHRPQSRSSALSSGSPFFHNPTIARPVESSLPRPTAFICCPLLLPHPPSVRFPAPVLILCLPLPTSNFHILPMTLVHLSVLSPPFCPPRYSGLSPRSLFLVTLFLLCSLQSDSIAVISWPSLIVHFVSPCSCSLQPHIPVCSCLPTHPLSATNALFPNGFPP
jgi:hypothetical protein